MRRVAVIVVASVLGLCRPASAGLGDETFDTEVSATPTPTGYVVGVSAWADGSVVTLGSDPLADCVILAGLEPQAVINIAGGRGINLGITHPDMLESEEPWVFMSCRDRVLDGFNWSVWEQGEPPPAAVVDALAEAARAAIVIPELTPQSAPDGLATPFLTQLPVWLWVPASSWVPVSGTASLPGLGLSITATATPETTDWVTDAEVNESLRCAAGTPWEPDLDDDATDCVATYTSTTPPGTTADLTVTTTFDVTLTCSPGLCGPAGPVVDDFTVTVSRPVTVTEARGLITR